MQYNTDPSNLYRPAKLMPPSIINQAKAIKVDKIPCAWIKKIPHSMIGEFPKSYSDAVVSNAKASISIQSINKEPVTRFVLWDNDNSLDYLRTRILERAGVFIGDEKGDLRNVVKRRNVDYKPYNMLKNLEISNLAPASEGNGVRGASLLSSKNKKYLDNLKDAGINRVIDLRTEGSAHNCAKACAQRGLEYFKFPIAFDEKWTQESIDKLPDLINEMKKGNYYIGCATGLHRTDTAFALNYIFDAASNVVPKLEAGGTENKMLAILNKIFASVNDICYKDKEKTVVRLTEDFAQKLGWSSLDELIKSISLRKVSLSNANKIIKQLGKF